MQIRKTIMTLKEEVKARKPPQKLTDELQNN